METRDTAELVHYSDAPAHHDESTLVALKRWVSVASWKLQGMETWVATEDLVQVVGAQAAVGKGSPVVP